MEYRIREQVRPKLLANYPLMGDLQRIFNKSYHTIKSWVNDNVKTASANKITTPEALKLIEEKTGLTREEILEPVEREAKVA